MANSQTFGSPLQSDQRLLSLDALRGFDMFWIIGGKEIAQAAAKLTNWPWLLWLSEQLEHTEWHGFTLYDLIFPLFLFMAGVAMPFSFAKRIEHGATKSELYRHVFVRALALVFLGMIYNDLMKFDWATMRYTSVLGHIGIAYFFAALIVLNANAIGQFIWMAGLLVAYWAMMKFIPVPGFGAGDLSPAHTLNDYLDRLLMPGQLKFGDRDPLGILATIPAVGTALAGAVTGHFLKSDSYSKYFKVMAMAIAGVVSFGLAYLWNFDFPINKNLWSSSFVLHCAGFSLLLLSLFYLIIDVWRFWRWSMVFVVIGSNSILMYLARRCVDFDHTTHYFFDGLIGSTGPYQPLLFAVAVVVVEWLMLLVLYKNRIFLKVNPRRMAGCFRTGDSPAQFFWQPRINMMNRAASTRREFLKSTTMALAGGAILNSVASTGLAAETKPLFKISLGEWAFHRALFAKSMKHFNVAKISKEECGIDALEYSAQFFMDKAEDMEYLRELKKRATDNGVKPVLITVDSQGNIGDPDEKQRLKAVNNHHKWVDAAKFLGCHSIRVNAISDEKLSADEQAKLVIDGLHRIVESRATRDINVIVENHGGISANGKWMVKVMKGVDLPTTGTLPDFGNFPKTGPGAYDRYLGVAEMMPYAKGVSAKSYGFDAEGNETTIDYRKMVKIVVDSGYHSYLGIEYEGDKMSEIEGVRATKKLLEDPQRIVAYGMMDDAPQLNASLPRDQRLMSLDALRGFDMFWIIGGVPIAKAAAELTGWSWLVWLSGQMHHTDWHGFTFYDLIFPLFLFLAGVAMPFSFSKRLDRGDGKLELCGHAIVRGFLLVFLGMIYNGLLKFDFANMRYASVLGRIGLAYMFAALIVINAKWPGQLMWAVGLLIGYWAALKFIPVPGYGPGDLNPGHTLTDYLDRMLLPGKLIHGNRDPEGLLSTIPAISTALAGAITGHFLKADRWNGYVKSIALVVAGLSCIALAQIWNLEFPINKNLWSSSFVLQCAGWSLLLATFYLVVDVWRLRTGALFFVVIGSNSILIYMGRQLINFRFTAHYFFDGPIKSIGSYSSLLWPVAIMVVQWLFLFLLYKKRIFVRV